MITEQKHIINKVFLEVDVKSISVAYKLKDNLDVFLKEDVLPYLERYFNSIEHKLPADIVQLPQLNLEVYVDGHNNFELLKKDTREKLVKEIDKLIKDPRPSENLILINYEERQIQTLLFFIEHGYAPWWKTATGSVLFTLADFKRCLSSDAFQNKFVTLLKKNSVKKRCILQFENKELQLLLNTIFKSEKEAELLNTEVIGKLKPLRSSSRMFIWTTIIDYMLSKNEKVLIQKLYAKLVEEINIKDEKAQFFAETTLIILKQLLRINKEITITVLKRPAGETSQKKETLSESILSLCSEIGLSDKAGSVLKPVGNQKTSKKNKIKPLGNNKVKQGIAYEENSNDSNPKTYYVQNAGLVIVHPYISHFLQNCRLLKDDNTFIDREMAVHALHYLATKKEQQFESDMVFEKFICGIPIKDSINRHIKLSEDIKNQAEELLKAVIENWGGLGSASTDLLRNEFLQRCGKLSFNDDNPKIIIERKTQDILVDKLPWGIGVFKLPWLDKLIFIDW
ncbi:contractile injection system tape measure protein [Mariniflexile sp. AS56]|uniref:contractile injection system tape measure protein n=1 Tax=Mariniflexile sp. AS56 TaxID=3063957 RepID=UPI0026E92ED2|nr:contractile injection system tape measure protein [Mariniflexile sp. AS56]MDO7174057.1 contractile injection system tape measure protein [Mariniflexile sp. AS56]